MLVREDAPDLYLAELSDLADPEPPSPVTENRRSLQTIATWAREYLAEPHPELGRDGPVCPYAGPSMKRGAFYMTVRHGTDFELDEVVETMRTLRQWFLEIEPTRGSGIYYKTILALFPDLPMERVPALLEGAQARLRSEFVERGLMISEFHPGPPQQAALCNPDFRPLGAPVPLLGVRHMVATDFGFLRDDDEMVLLYLQHFHDQIPQHLREQVQEVAIRCGFPLSKLEELDGVPVGAGAGG